LPVVVVLKILRQIPLMAKRMLNVVPCLKLPHPSLYGGRLVLITKHVRVFRIESEIENIFYAIESRGQEDEMRLILVCSTKYLEFDDEF
jgi:hypothetical protein